jgi:hypothetical protein
VMNENSANRWQGVDGGQAAGRGDGVTTGNARVDLDKVQTAVRKWLLLPESALVVEVLLAAVVANRLEGDPFWLFLVNPPSGVKTELINTLPRSGRHGDVRHRTRETVRVVGAVPDVSRRPTDRRRPVVPARLLAACRLAVAGH